MTTNALNRGEVEIMLDGQPRILKPTLQAFQNIGSAGAYRDLLPRVTRCDLGTIAFILRHGLGMKDDEASKLPEMLFRTGLPSLAGPVAEYLFRLFNAGKSPEEVNAELEADQGNAPAAG